MCTELYREGKYDRRIASDSAHASVVSETVMANSAQWPLLTSDYELT
jgi:hypothetical protein